MRSLELLCIISLINHSLYFKVGSCMNKVTWAVLVILLLVFVVFSGVFSPPEVKKQQEAAPVNLANNDPLFKAIHSADYTTVEAIIKQKPHILKEKNLQGGTYMNCTASSKDVKMMKLIIKLGGNINQASDCGTTPILMASKQDDIAMVRVLLDAGANPNVFATNTSPLTNAIQHHNKEMIKLLIKHGARETL